MLKKRKQEIRVVKGIGGNVYYCPGCGNELNHPATVCQYCYKVSTMRIRRLRERRCQ